MKSLHLQLENLKTELLNESTSLSEAGAVDALKTFGSNLAWGASGGIVDLQTNDDDQQLAKWLGIIVGTGLSMFYGGAALRVIGSAAKTAALGTKVMTQRKFANAVKKAASSMPRVMSANVNLGINLSKTIARNKEKIATLTNASTQLNSVTKVDDIHKVATALKAKYPEIDITTVLGMKDPSFVISAKKKLNSLITAATQKAEADVATDMNQLSILAKESRTLRSATKEVPDALNTKARMIKLKQKLAAEYREKNPNATDATIDAAVQTKLKSFGYTLKPNLKAGGAAMPIPHGVAQATGGYTPNALEFNPVDWGGNDYNTVKAELDRLNSTFNTLSPADQEKVNTLKTNFKRVKVPK